MLVEEVQRRVRRRHLHQPADTEAEQDAALYPGDGAPFAIGAAHGGPQHPRLQGPEQRVDRRLGVARQPVRRQREQRLDLRFKPFGRGAHSETPAMRSAARIRASCFASIGTSGRRSTFCIFPIMAMPALIGIGLLSMNAASTRGESR